MNKFIFILLSSQLAYLPQTLTISHKNEELFHEINRNLENTLNRLFTLLQLNENFTHESKNEILLSIHGNIKTVAERNYKTFKIVAKSSKLSHKYKPSDGLNLRKLCETIVQGKLTPDNTAKANESKKTGINIHLTPIQIPDKLEDSISFLKEYFSNTENTHAINKDSPIYKIKKEYEKYKYKVKKRRKLRVWKASNNINVTLRYYNDTRRLYHGKNVKIKKYPFLASIHVMRKFVCAGSIISKNMIITAATCLHVTLTSKSFLEENPEGIEVRVGSAYTQKFGEVRYVTHIFFHPKYNIENLHNNLAILQIDRLYFTKEKKIRRIEYARWKGGLPRRVKDIIMLGWGDKETQISGEFDPLSYSILSIFNQNKCTVTYSGKYVNENNFCAGFVNKGSGACQRDVGGPAVLGSILVGVVSFGPPVCGTPNAPTVFSSISFHAAWIDSIVNRSLSKKQVRSNIGYRVLNENQNNKMLLEQRSQTIPTTTVTENKSIVIPKSQYPQAIQVLQNLLTKLTKDEKKNTKDETEYNDRKDINNGIVVDFDELARIHSKPKADKNVGNRLLYNHGGSKVMRARKEFETEKVKQAGVAINGSQIIDELVTGFQTELIKQSLMSGSRDPFFLAIKSLGSYLGLEKILHVTEDYELLSPTTTKVVAMPRPKTMPYRARVYTRPKQESTRPSWNLGVEYFASSHYPRISNEIIEAKAGSFNENNLRTEFSRVNSTLKATDSTTVANSNDIVTINDEESIDIDESNASKDSSDNYESESKGLSIETRSQTDLDRAQQFLNKNFVKDNDVIVTSNEKSDELVVVLVSKATTEMTETPDNKLRQQIRLDLNGTPIMLPSRFSVISNTKNLILLETNESNNTNENQFDFTVDKIPDFFAEDQESIFDDKDFRKIPVSQTTAPGPIYRANTDSIGKTNEFTVMKSEFAVSSTDNTFNTDIASTINNSSCKNLSTDKNVNDSYATITNNISNTTFNYANDTFSNISSSTTKRELTMAAYDIAEVFKEVEEDKKIEDDSNSYSDKEEGSRRLLDYINIT